MTPRTRILISVIPAMILPLLAAFFYFVLFPAAQQAWGIYAGTKIFILLWPLIALLLIQKKRPTGQPIDWAKHVRAIPLGLGTGAIIVAWGISVYEFTAVGEYVRTYAGEIRTKVEELNLGVSLVYILFTGGISLLHSLLEEYYWRWFVFGQLEKVLKPWPAYLVASLAFASFHYVVLSSYFPPLGVFGFGTLVGIGGLLWCWMLRRQKSLVGIWVSHALVDAGIFYIGYDLLFLQ